MVQLTFHLRRRCQLEKSILGTFWIPDQSPTFWSEWIRIVFYLQVELLLLKGKPPFLLQCMFNGCHPWTWGKLLNSVPGHHFWLCCVKDCAVAVWKQQRGFLLHSLSSRHLSLECKHRLSWTGDASPQEQHSAVHISSPPTRIHQVLSSNLSWVPLPDSPQSFSKQKLANLGKPFTPRHTTGPLLPPDQSLKGKCWSPQFIQKAQ